MTRYHDLVRPIAATILLGSPIITLGTGCSQQSSTPESPAISTPVRAAGPASDGPASTRLTTLAVPVGSPGSEAEAVKQTLTKMQTAKNITEMADFVSSDTAGVLGMVMTLPMAMAISMQEMVSHGLGGNSGTPPLKTDPTLKTDLERIMKKYGMDTTSSATPSEAQAKLAGRGREFLKEIGGLMDRMDRMQANGKQKSSHGRDNALKMSVRPDQVEYKVVSPTEVSLVPKPGVSLFGKGAMKNGKQVPLKAIVEDGHWRIHMGGLKDLGAMMGGDMPARGMAVPPGGMGMPPGGFGMPPTGPGK